MISEFLRFALAALVLVLGGATEDLIPKAFGVGAPVLLASVPFMVARCNRMEALAFAVAAGAMEEALSSLPPMAGVGFFLAVALVVRRVGLVWPLAMLVYPVYQVWLAVWLVGIGGGVFSRILVSLPIGFLTVLAVGVALKWLCRKAAVDEQG